MMLKNNLWRSRGYEGSPSSAFPASLAVSGSCSTGWVRVEVGKIGYSFIPECIKIASTVGWVSVPGWSVIFRLVVPELFFLSSFDQHAPANRQLSLVSSTVILIPFNRIVRVLNTIIRKCRTEKIELTQIRDIWYGVIMDLIRIQVVCTNSCSKWIALFPGIRGYCQSCASTNRMLFHDEVEALLC
jgi:hypothetical protein